MTTNTNQFFQAKARISASASHVGRFVWHFLEMQAAMAVGGFLFTLLIGLIPDTSTYADVFQRGTYSRSIGSNAMMTITMVAWMVLRKHGWRHSFEMALAMLVPVAVLMVVRLLGADIYIPWLAKMSCVVMSLGMLAGMLYRKDHYTGQTRHSGHTADLQVEAACHTD